MNFPLESAFNAVAAVVLVLCIFIILLSVYCLFFPMNNNSSEERREKWRGRKTSIKVFLMLFVDCIIRGFHDLFCGPDYYIGVIEWRERIAKIRKMGSRMTTTLRVKLTQKPIVQVYSKKYDRYFKINRNYGDAYGMKKTKGPYKGVPIIGIPEIDYPKHDQPDFSDNRNLPVFVQTELDKAAK